MLRRLARADELLPRPLPENVVSVAAALEVAALAGDRALTRPVTAGGGVLPVAVSAPERRVPADRRRSSRTGDDPARSGVRTRTG